MVTTEKHAEYQRTYRAKHPERYAEKRRKDRKRQRQAKLDIIREAKDVPCADCGKSYPYYVMDFDHLDPSQKSFNIGTQMQNRGRGPLLAEIAKCEVVCSNCHRERTHGSV